MLSQTQQRDQQQQQVSPDKDWKYLRRCLLATDLYKQTQYFLQGVFDKNTEVISTILATISSVLSDSDELPQTRLRGLRFIKEALEAESISALIQNSISPTASTDNTISISLPFNVALQHSNILPRLSKLIIENNVHSDPSTLLLNSQTSSPTQSEAECGYCFYYLCRECLYIWSKLYPNSDDDESQQQSAFAIAEQSINENSNCSNSNKLFQLPQNMRFFREEYESKNVANIFEKMQMLGVLANEKINELNNLPTEQGFDTGRGLERAVSDFGYIIEQWRNIEKLTNNKSNNNNGNASRYRSNDKQSGTMSLSEDFQQENYTFYKLLMLVCILHQSIKNYQDSKVNYTEMRDLILGFIRDRGGLNISSYGVLMEECSNHLDTWFDRGCEDVLKERRQQEQQFELLSSQAQSRKQQQQQQQQRMQDQQQQSSSQLFNAVAGGSKGVVFDFEEEKEVERLHKRVVVLEKDVLQKDQTIQTLKDQTKKLELTIEEKQDEFDLMITKNNYFSYPKDYHELLMKFQKLEADFIEQSAAQLKIKEENAALLEAKNSYEESKEQLTGIINNQKSTIQQLQITISRLNEEIADFKKNQQNFKKDCERKYAINAVLSSGGGNNNQIQGTDVLSRMNMKSNQNIAASIYPNSNQITQVKSFKEKDFLRGVLVSDQGKEQLNAGNNQNDQDDNNNINSYAFKLGCLKQSVVILENDFLKVHFKASFNGSGNIDEKVEQRLIGQLAAGAMKRRVNESIAQVNQQQQQQQDIIKDNLEFNDSEQEYEDIDIPVRQSQISQNQVNIQISVLNKCGFFLDINLRVRLTNGLLIRDLQYKDETTRLNRSDCWVQNIQLEMSSLPFISPELILTQKSFTLNNIIPITLPITILNIVTWNIAPLPDVLNQFIDIWSDNDQLIRKTTGFNVDKKLIGQTSSMSLLLPGLTQIPQISLNICEFLGNGYINVGTMIPFLIKASLINNRFLTFQGRLLENKQSSHHLQALDILINTLTMVFGQAQ